MTADEIIKDDENELLNLHSQMIHQTIYQEHKNDHQSNSNSGNTENNKICKEYFDDDDL